MQKGIIKEVSKHAQEGKKTFYRVKLQDGAEMSTFDPKIEQAESGDGLEFEAVVSGKFINLKDGFTITKGTSSVAPSKGNGYPDMSKEDWAEKQRLERASIETQVAVKSLLKYASEILSDGSGLDEDGRRIIGKALAWCEAKIDATMNVPVKPPVKAPVKVKTPQKEKPAPINPDEIELDSSPVKSLGELWTRCKNYGIPRTEGLQLLELDNQEQIVDLDEAWRTIFDRKFAKPKEITEKDITF